MAFFYRFHEMSGLKEALMGSCIKPSEPATQQLDMQRASFHVRFVDACNFKFPALGRFNFFGNLNDIVVVKI
ncbi:hypothetical protein D3C80_2006530 [compost metagenome]